MIYKRITIALLVLAAILTVSLLYFQPLIINVKGISMEPEIEEGDWALIFRNSGKPAMEDIVVFERFSSYNIKRIKGLPGGKPDFNVIPFKYRDKRDSLELTIPHIGMNVTPNDVEYFFWKKTLVKELRKSAPEEKKVRSISKLLQSFNGYTFRENYYFMLGDNLSGSVDSRTYGVIPESDIIGEFMFVIW